MYTIKGITDLAGVTALTLRYYDQLELLIPVRIGENGCRNYDDDNLLRLQQSIFAVTSIRGYNTAQQDYLVLKSEGRMVFSFQYFWITSIKAFGICSV